MDKLPLCGRWSATHDEYYFNAVVVIHTLIFTNICSREINSDNYLFA